MNTGLFSGPVDWRAVVIGLIATLVISAFAAIFARRLVRRALNAAVGEHLTPSSPLVRGPLRLVAIATFLLIASLVIFPAFELSGLHPSTGITSGEIVAWVLRNGRKVLLIALLAYALHRITALLVRRFEYRVSQGTTIDALERAKRARTLGSLVQNVSTVLISSVATVMILYEFGVNITPVLTGAGIAGLAVGFGAQTLVRDVIGGFFMILEDQVRVGDVAAINGVGGLVEQINLRTIVLRDEEGALHVFPNGGINTLANRSKDFSYYVITLAIPYQEDPDRIIGILRDVGDGLKNDSRFGPFILEPVEILGLDAFGEWAMQIKLRIKTVPLKQWDVGREFRKRIRKALAAAGVTVPYPAIAATVPHPPPGPERQ
ncbi:MAG TPA: mechanosensitive ion channel family protein [Vicinamibacterales bacterium]|jgi:small conductance mechanosensitive channel